MRNGESLVGTTRLSVRDAPSDKPVFCWVNFLDMHTPYCAPGRWMPASDALERIRPVHLSPHQYPDSRLTDEDKRYIRRRYDSTAMYVGACIQGFLDWWDSLRRKRSRLTILISDHGEEFWERGDDLSDQSYYGRGVGHGHTLFNELIHVPFVVHWPGSVIAGKSVGRLVSPVDLIPTLVDLLELDEDLSTMAGRSLVAEITSPSRGELDDRIVFSDSLLYGAERQAAISATHKLIRKVDGDEMQLFAWGTHDPGETRDLAGTSEATSEQQQLEAALVQWNSSFSDSESDHSLSDRELEEMMVRLRDLGYV